MEHRKQARRKAYGRSISGRSARGKGGRSSDGGAGKNGAATPLAGTWDLESGNGSGSPKHCGATEDAAPQVAGTPGSETSAGAASAGGPQSQSQQSPPPTARSDYEMRPTALQVGHLRMMMRFYTYSFLNTGRKACNCQLHRGAVRWARAPAARPALRSWPPLQAPDIRHAANQDRATGSYPHCTIPQRSPTRGLDHCC